LIQIISFQIFNGSHSSLKKYLSPSIFSSYRSVTSAEVTVIVNQRFLFFPIDGKGTPGVKAPINSISFSSP